MASQEAICRIRVEESLQRSLPSGDISRVPIKIRLEWAKLMTEEILSRGMIDDDNCGVRDLDFVLDLDGSVENRADNASSSSSSSPSDRWSWAASLTGIPGRKLISSSSPSTRSYPARYRIPSEIIERLGSSQEKDPKVQRAELFALGGLLYQVFSGIEMLSDLGSDEKGEYIRSCFVKGEFPEDVWELPHAVKILACWCPGFAEDLLVAHSENKFVLSKFASYVIAYVKKHPVLFGIQVAGGIMYLASIAALPVLGVVGFGAAGPIAGSTAAAWQSSIGLVKAGSIFAWCQSAAMGGAAMGGIQATGLAGVGSVAVGGLGAIVAGALDRIAISESELKEIFLKAWKRGISDGGAAMGGILATDLAGVDVAVGAIVEGALDGIDIPALELKEKFLTAWKRDIGEAQYVMTARL